MNTTRNIILTAILLLSLPSCVKTTTDIAKDNYGEMITFGTSLTRSAVTTDPQGVISGMSDYAVWGWYHQSPAEANPTEVFSNTTVNHQTGTYEGTRYWVNGMTYNFYALHPAGMETSGTAQSVSCNSDGCITVTGFDTSKTGKDAIDLMTAQSMQIIPVQGTNPGSVSLPFKHELSRINFLIENIAEDLTVNYVEITGVAYKGDYKTLSGQETDPWTNKESIAADIANSPQNPFRKEINKSLTLTDKNIDLFEGDLLLIPQELNPNCVFTMSWTYKTSGKERTVHVPFTEVAYPKWEKGKSYRYSASIPSYESDVTLNVKVQDWNAKTTIDVELN